MFKPVSISQQLQDIHDKTYERSVTPRQPKHQRFSVVAISENSGVLLERIWSPFLPGYTPALATSDAAERILEPEIIESGLQTFRFYPFDHLHILFPLLPKDTIIVSDSMTSIAHYLYRLYRRGYMRTAFTPMHGEFDIMFSEKEQDISWRPDEPRITHTVHRVTSLKFNSLSDKKSSHCYIPVDAPDFFRNSSLRDFKWDLHSLMQVGQVLADECSDIGVRMGCSPGSVAARMLRLDTYYHSPRRRMPRATNERARTVGVGHDYELKGKVNESYPYALQFDQIGSHASIAASIDLPSSNLLYARGDFHKTERYRSSRLLHYKELIKQHGIFSVILYNPNPDNPWLPKRYRRDGEFQAYITSNEIDWLLANGVRIEGIYASWTSPNIDQGIRNYALNGLERIDRRTGIERSVIKTVINAGIGVLSAKPRRPRLIRTNELRGAEPFMIRTRHGELPVYRKEFSEYQLSVANMVQKAMIDRECVKRTYEFAATLDSLEWEILDLYADSVFAIPPPGQQPLFEAPSHWKVEIEHTNIQFKTATTWISDQCEKAPGITLSERSRIRTRFKSD